MDVTEGVLLEMGVRGGPEPASRRIFTSYIAEFALARGERDDAFDEMAPVEIDVLLPARTLIEKLAHVHHLSAGYPGTGKWIPMQGRHLYDIYCLLGDAAVRDALAEEGFAERIAADRAARSATYHLATTARPEDGFAASPAFDVDHQSHADWRRAYAIALALVYGAQPTLAACHARVREYAHLL